MNFAIFTSAFDNQVKQVDEHSWEELVDLLSVHRRTDVKNDLGFILGTFKPIGEAREAKVSGQDDITVTIPGTVGRYAENVLEMHALCIDYDDGPSIDEVKHQLTGIRHLGYTSYNHLKDGVIQKFRVVIPLATSCPAADWKKRKDGFLTLFPGCDPSSFDLGRIFYAPSTPKSQQRVTVAWNQDGDPFDWQEVPAVEPMPPRAPMTYVIGDAHSDGDLIINTKPYGSLPARELYDLLTEGYHHRINCYKLSGVDNTPTCFIYRQGTGLRYFGTDGEKRFIKCYSATVTLPKLPVKELEGDEDLTPLEEIKLDERAFNPPMEAGARNHLVQTFVKQALHHKHAVLRTAEGFGKSFGLVSALLREGKDILFCSASNAQANEKTESFKLFGAERAWSLRALIEHRLGVSAVMIASTEPWGMPVLDKDATVAVIAEKHGCSSEEAEQALKELQDEAHQSTQSGAQLLVTTFHTGDRLQRQGIGRTIIVDDPSVSDLLLHQVELTKDGFEITAERGVDETIFATPQLLHGVIWTTTEKLVVEVIKRHHPEVYVKDVQEALAAKHHILIHPTWLVRRLTKAVLPGVHLCVEHNTKRDIKLLMNGAGTALNLVSTKGRNDLKGDSCIVISHPHPVAVKEAALTLQLPDWEVTAQMVVDVLDQALGRTHGHRACDARTLVLCDPKLQASLMWRSRYQLTTLDGLKRRGRLKGVPLVFAEDQPEWWSEWLGYVLTWQEWVRVIGGRVINTLTLHSHQLTKREQVAKMQALLEPVRRENERRGEKGRFSQLVWRQLNEVLEGEGRRNFSVTLAALVEDANKRPGREDVATSNKTNNKTNNKSKPRKPNTGRKKYVNELGEAKMFRPDQVPAGWRLKKAGR